MSLTLKRIIIVFLGLMGACMVWPILLSVQHFQNAFPGFLSFAIAQGIAFGLVFGAIFGSIEGIVVSSRPKAFHGLIFGAIAGIASGALGVIAGQSFLFHAADALQGSKQMLSGVSLVLANGAGWMLIGVFIAMIEGFRSRSIRKILVGLAGGVVGGIIGGGTLQLTLMGFPGNQYALLAGLATFGVALSFFYSFFENRFSLGTVKILNGRLKNKEYHLSKTRMSVGTKDTCDIVLADYRDVSPVHAYITVRKGQVILSSAGEDSPIKINDEAKTEAALRREDVFATGNAKFIYGFFS